MPVSCAVLVVNGLLDLRATGVGGVPVVGLTVSAALLLASSARVMLTHPFVAPIGSMRTLPRDSSTVTIAPCCNCGSYSRIVATTTSSRCSGKTS